MVRLPPWFDTALLAPDSLTTRSRYPVPEQMTSQTNTNIKFYERGGHVRDKKRFAESKVHRPLSPNPTYGATPPTTPPILIPTYPNPILAPSLFQPELDPLRTNLRTQFARALALHPSLTTRNA